MDKLITISRTEFYGIGYSNEGVDVTRVQWVERPGRAGWEETEGMTVPWAVWKGAYFPGPTHTKNPPVVFTKEVGS